MQNVRGLSSLTNELIQVTSSSALRSMTSRQNSAPPLSTEMRSPSGNVRCTTYRRISVLLVDWPSDKRPTYEPPHAPASGRSPMLGGADPHLAGTAQVCSMGYEKPRGRSVGSSAAAQNRWVSEPRGLLLCMESSTRTLGL